MNIGSRPARRKATQDIGGLRAIPWTFAWTFAWTQTRLHLPAWLGTGEALTTLFEEGMEPSIRNLASDFAFFRSLMDLLAMVLSKADPEIAAYYDRVLVPDELRPLGQELRTSCERTIGAILRARNDRSLLEREPELRRTLALRHCSIAPLRRRPVDPGGESMPLGVEHRARVPLTSYVPHRCLRAFSRGSAAPFRGRTPC